MPGKGSKASSKQPTAQEPAPSPDPPREATSWDLERHDIPTQGYSQEYWDPEERPILLLGAIFHASSYGKYIYDWACETFPGESGHAFRLMAGNLWTSLIGLSNRMKRIKSERKYVPDGRKLKKVSDCLANAERLWKAHENLVGKCEDHMWQLDEETGQKTDELKDDSAQAFIKAMFGREYKLRKTEEMIHKLDLWIRNFDEQVAPVLGRNPMALVVYQREPQSERPPPPRRCNKLPIKGKASPSTPKPSSGAAAVPKKPRERATR